MARSASEKPPEVGDRGPVLLAVARASLERALLGAVEPLWRQRWLREPGATFVTLRVGGELRGCVGTLSAERPLVDDVRSNARAAALEDRRFRPLGRPELAATTVEVSLLSPLEPLRCADEEQALASLRPGRDGLCLAWGRHRGTFLPQVWRQLPDPRRFLAQLKVKAGLDEGFWHPDLRLWTYGVSRWAEPKRPAS